MALNQERLGEWTSLEPAMGIRSSLGFRMWTLKLAYEEVKGAVVRNAGAEGDRQEDSRPCPNARGWTSHPSGLSWLTGGGLLTRALPMGASSGPLGLGTLESLGTVLEAEATLGAIARIWRWQCGSRRQAAETRRCSGLVPHRG